MMQILMITLVKPPLNDDELKWRKGRRMDNRAKKRHHDGHDAEGVRFFVDDEDHYYLEDPLMALCFQDDGKAYVPFSYKNTKNRR